MQVDNKQSKFHNFLKSASYVLPLRLRKLFMDPVYGNFIFSKFKETEFDEAGWKFVVPEVVAKNFAKNFRGQKILDAYAGIGGTSIQLALAGNDVTSFEIDPKRFKCLEHNAKIYQADKLKSVNADVKEYLTNHNMTFDVICVDPPWKDIKTDFISYIDFFKKFAPILVFSVSKNIPNDQIFPSGAQEIREVYLNDTLFHREAFYYRDRAAGQSVIKEAVSAPEIRHIFP